MEIWFLNSVPECLTRLKLECTHQLGIFIDYYARSASRNIGASRAKPQFIEWSLLMTSIDLLQCFHQTVSGGLDSSQVWVFLIDDRNE